MSPKPPAPTFASLLQDFFCQRLIAQRNASARTIASYRDAFRLLLRYAEMRIRKQPFVLTLADLDVPLVVGFLDYLEETPPEAATPGSLPFAPSYATRRSGIRPPCR